MLKTALTAFVLTIGVLATGKAALAEEERILKQECNAPFPISLFQETSTGENCPPNAAEKGVGQIIVAGTVFLIGAELMTGDVFPLNGGILSGVASGL